MIRRVFERGAYADRAFASEARDLEPRERAFAMQLAYGTVQRRVTLDYVAERLSARRTTEIEPHVVAALRLGLFQILFLGGVAAHAAVNESVELAKQGHGGGFKLVNAVLRRATSEGRAIVEGLGDSSPSEAAVRHSAPDWLAELWWRELGPDTARRLLARANEPAESALRVNTLMTTPPEVQSELPAHARPAPGLPEGLVLDGAFDAQASDLWRRGAIMPQSRASMLVARTLDPKPGQQVLDLCAAPGGKTTHLAALMENRGEVLAVERHSGRARALVETCDRMGASCVRVEVGDAADARPVRRFDRVLVDPPCSGLGTLQSRPDLRWRASPAAVGELGELQSQILAAGAGATAPGGTLVYSVCTISRAESESVIDRFLASQPDFDAEDLQAEHPQWRHPQVPLHLQLLPDRDRTDGFFIARLRRA